jgi:hypothetical protein
MEFLGYLWQLVDVLSLDRDPYPCPTEEDVHKLIKSPRGIHRKITAIKARYVITVKRFPRRHKRPHTRHYFLVPNSRE